MKEPRLTFGRNYSFDDYEQIGLDYSHLMLRTLYCVEDLDKVS